MSRFHLLRQLISPSLTSGTVCVLAAWTFLLTMSWQFIANSALSGNNYFFGKYGLVTHFQLGSADFTQFLQTTVGPRLWRDAVTFLFVLGIGIVVYTTVQSSNRVLNAALNEWVEVHDARASFRTQIRAQVLHRIGFRLGTVLGWLVYWLAFVHLILPFCVSAAQYSMATIRTPQGWLYLALSLVLLPSALHLHVVCMRLLALRPRLFGA